MCWPISHLTICIVTLPSGVSVNQIEGVKLDIPSAFAALLPSAGRPMFRKVPAAVAAERTKNSRRLVAACVSLSMTASIIHDLGRALHRTDDPRIGGTTTHVARHAIHDLLLSRMGIPCKQGRGLHDLAGLTIATSDPGRVPINAEALRRLPSGRVGSPSMPAEPRLHRRRSSPVPDCIEQRFALRVGVHL